MIICKTHSFILTDDYRVNNTSRAVKSSYRRNGAESLLFRHKQYLWEKGLGATKEIPKN